ncbi:uncharacterized protein LOC132714507 [Ruditapes philippinarum]|uniref:uncharacterized protein LOC132714507 n=1 Tax=Ruditapes philippinarum TaxID=129788 RepID=UPI00295A9020|nr:uncharacterized protein LOC132714507 [Ruditapes philippinarum]
MNFSTIIYERTKRGESTNRFEENVEDFLIKLFKDVLVEERWASEISDLKSATREMMERFIIEAFEFTDDYNNEILKKCLKPVGSMEDGTSICKPDEFDFIFEIPYPGFEAKPSTNPTTLYFPTSKCPRLVVKPCDVRFRRLFQNQAEVQSTSFLQHFCMKFTKAVAALSKTEPVKRGNYRLQMLDPSDDHCSSGFQGPAFHLHNHLVWISPSGHEHFVSIDLVPVVVLQDEELCRQVPKFDQNDENDCEHELPTKYYLIPMKSRSIHSTVVVAFDGEDNEMMKDFALSNFTISFADYENSIMKQWKSEISAYHNWYICYTLMKCFGTIDHTCSNYVNIGESGTVSLSISGVVSIPERNESLSSYAWKLLIFEQAKIYDGLQLSLYECFVSIISMFKSSNLISIPAFTINSFWCQEVTETVYLLQQNTSDQRTEMVDKMTDMVDKMTELNTLIQEIYQDKAYTYHVYRNKLVTIFPELKEALSSTER